MWQKLKKQILDLLAKKKADVVRYENKLGNIVYSYNNAVFNQNKTIVPNSIIPADNLIQYFTIEPELPSGLVFNTETGEISGIPAEYFKDEKSFTVTGCNDLESVSTTFTIRCIHPIPPSLELDQNVVVVYHHESISIHILNNGGPIDSLEIEGDLPEGISFDSESNIISGAGIYSTTCKESGNRYNATKVYRIEAENSGGKSVKYLHLTILEQRESFEGDVLNIQNLFEYIQTLDGNEMITETLYGVYTTDTRVPTLNWRCSACFENAFDVAGEEGRATSREITRSYWLSHYPYLFFQSGDIVTVFKKFSTEFPVAYQVDRYASESNGCEDILEIVRVGDNPDYPEFFRFYYLNCDNPPESLYNQWYITYHLPSDFTYTTLYGDDTFTETKSVVITNGIQIIPDSMVQDRMYKIQSILPAELDNSWYNTSLSLIEYFESIDPISYYVYTLLPMIE